MATNKGTTSPEDPSLTALSHRPLALVVASIKFSIHRVITVAAIAITLCVIICHTKTRQRPLLLAACHFFDRAGRRDI